MKIMTEGMKTSEFYITVAIAVTGFLVALGVIGPDAAEAANAYVADIVEAAGVLVMALAAGGYSIGRGIAKSGK